MKMPASKPFQAIAISGDPPERDNPADTGHPACLPAPTVAPTSPRLPQRAGMRVSSSCLQQLPNEILQHIVDECEYGSAHVSNLASTSKAMRLACFDRALADRLIAAIQLPVDSQAVSAHLIQVVEDANRLPSNLRVEVLSTIPARLTAHLRSPTLGFEHVFEALAVALEQLDGPHWQYRLLNAVGAEFADADLQRSCLVQQGQGLRSMGTIYIQLSRSIDVLLTLHGAAIAASTGVDRNMAGNSGKNRLFSEALGMQARGLYMLANPDERSMTWDSLRQDLRCGDGVERQALLEGLTDALPHLANIANRRAGLAFILAEVGRFPAELQPAMHARLAAQLRHFTTGEIDQGYALLLAIGVTLPPTQMAQSLVAFAGCLEQVAPFHTKAIFDGIMNHLPRLAPDGQATVVAALSARIVMMPEESDRLNAFDAVWDVYCTIDPFAKAVSTVLANLVGTIASLPCDERQLVRFSRLTDCLTAQPNDCENGLIEHLVDAIWALEMPSQKMAAFRDVLLLVSDQPSVMQPDLLTLLIEIINDQHFDDTRFSMLAAFERVVRRLPVTMQAALLGEAAFSAMWLDTPFMEARFAALVGAARALPEPHADQALSLIDETFVHIVAELDDPEQDSLPMYFNAILETCRVMPQATQVRTLDALVDTVREYPPAVAQLARNLIMPRLEALPEPIHQRLQLRLNGWNGG